VTHSSTADAAATFAPSGVGGSEVMTVNKSFKDARCKLSQRDLGQSPGQNRFWCILALKSDIWIWWQLILGDRF